MVPARRFAALCDNELDYQTARKVYGMAQQDSPAHDARIRIVGVGGAGGRVIDAMMLAGIPEAQIAVIDTDADALARSRAPKKIHLVAPTLSGPNAGVAASPGRRAAQEASETLRLAVERNDVLFIVAGMGGETGSGCAPVLGGIARQEGVLTIGVVTAPFTFEGRRRDTAAEAIDTLTSAVDLLTVVPCDLLLHVSDRKFSMDMAFAFADEFVQLVVRILARTFVEPSIAGISIADLNGLLPAGGRSSIGIGRASGLDRATYAALQALTSPLLRTAPSNAIRLFYAVAADQLSPLEAAQVATLMVAEAGEGKVSCLGVVSDGSLGDDLLVMVIALGSDRPDQQWEVRRPGDWTPGGGIPPSDQRIPRRPPHTPLAGTAQAMPPAAPDDVDAVGTVDVPWWRPEPPSSSVALPGR